MAQTIGDAVALTDDAYHSIAGLFGFAGGTTMRMHEGFLSAITFGLTVRFGDGSQPATAAGGLPLPSGATMTFGPVRDPQLAWPVDRIWVRNAAAGSNATVVCLAVGL